MRTIHYFSAAVLAGALVLGLGCGSTAEEGLASEELTISGALMGDGGAPDAGTVDGGTSGGGSADAGSTRKKVSCASNPNKCYSSPEPDCSCRDSDGVCINAYGEYCEW